MATIKVKNNDGNWISVATANQGGGGVSVEPMVLTGNCESSCTGILGGKYIELFGNTISTENVSNAYMMFNGSSVETIQFDINMDRHANPDLNNMFMGCSNLKELPKIYNAAPGGLSNFVTFCRQLREIPEDYVDTWDFSYAHENGFPMGSIFWECCSLRNISSNFLKNLWNKATSAYDKPYGGMFRDCYSLNEVVELGIGDDTPAIEENMFDGTFSDCNMLKRITFETNEDGTPKVANWKNQTIDLTYGSGWVNDLEQFLQTSDITADKEVMDDESYQALKNDPDWFTILWEYSRYNHDSAVETINSLPDTSANGITNTIKFKSVAGQYTDGGAISTLTEDEIAVATAKGWNVVLE